MEIRTPEIELALSQWRHGATILDYKGIILDIVAVFDHDYLGVHLLCSVHQLVEGKAHYEYKGYQLWYLTADDEYFVRATWSDVEQGHAPFVQASTLVENWYYNHIKALVKEN